MKLIKNRKFNFCNFKTLHIKSCLKLLISIVILLTHLNNFFITSNISLFVIANQNTTSTKHSKIYDGILNNNKINELSLVGTLKGGLYAVDNEGNLKWSLSIGKPLMYQKADLEVS